MVCVYRLEFLGSPCPDIVYFSARVRDVGEVKIFIITLEQVSMSVLSEMFIDFHIIHFTLGMFPAQERFSV